MLVALALALGWTRTWPAGAEPLQIAARHPALAAVMAGNTVVVERGILEVAGARPGPMWTVLVAPWPRYT